MTDLRLPLTIKPVPGGFAIVFADGEQRIFVEGQDPLAAAAGSSQAEDEALELAKEIARALMAAWDDPLRSAA